MEQTRRGGRSFAAFLESMGKIFTLGESFPDAQTGRSGRVYVTFCQHAKLSIALHFLHEGTTTTSDKKIEIGVPKASYYWCAMWLDVANNEFRSTSKEIIVRASHGKRTDGWTLPQDEPVHSALLNRMGLKIEVFFEACVTSRRKSDSKPLSDQGEDEGPGPKIDMERY
ncbi:MAG: hypothetical protein Q9181_006089 [Wetmoreana brouardii]